MNLVGLFQMHSLTSSGDKCGFGAFDECLANQSGSCYDCIDDVFSSDCDGICPQLDVCTANDCDLSSDCQNDVVEFFNCFFDKETDCDVSCSSRAYDSCEDEFQLFDECLASQSGDCYDCMDDVFAAETCDESCMLVEDCVTVDCALTTQCQGDVVDFIGCHLATSQGCSSGCDSFGAMIA